MEDWHMCDFGWNLLNSQRFNELLKHLKECDECTLKASSIRIEPLAQPVEPVVIEPEKEHIPGP